MSEWNELEKQLGSWIPRPPAPRVEERLFGRLAAAGGATVREAGELAPAPWHWMAPAMAVFFFGLFLAGRSPTGLSGLAGLSSTGVVATVAFIHPDLASYTAGSHHSDNNTLPAATFEWTNGSHSLTTAVPELKNQRRMH